MNSIFKKMIIGSFLLTCLLGCKVEDKEQLALLEGKWLATKWLIEGEENNYDLNKINFTFKSGNLYEARLGDRREKGSFHLYDDKLYTQNGGAAQIVVNVDKLTVDSLIFNMNRGGQQEQLFFIKEK